ncbi:hypothetical protein FACS1894156_0190 [Bacteroidia bacterium]|nr:hypothetical protein FACS1894156_0190 [Bacteroidia bacterium]
MANHIEYVHITNFKSIRNLNLKGCRRINLFIGYPNVGKSNILEALGLFSLTFPIKGGNILDFVRIEGLSDFFNNNESSCEISINNRKIIVNPNMEDSGFAYSLRDGVLKLNILGVPQNIKFYKFQLKNRVSQNTSMAFLEIPYGENLADVLAHNNNVADIKAWMTKEFAKFGLTDILDLGTHSIKLQRSLGENKVIQLPYSSVADTLQRMIFYRTAIASNQDSVLIFEEPEAHAFPPYITILTYDIAKSKSNQFFIATHSDLIVKEFFENAELCKELSIYVVDFKDGQTTARRLTDEEMDEVCDKGIDLFFGMERYMNVDL